MARSGSGDELAVRSVRRALDILSLLNARKTTLTLRDVIRETGLPRTTAIRLLRTLVDYAVLWEVAPNTYVAGPAFLRWIGLASGRWSLPHEFRMAMRQATDATRETSSIYVSSGLRRVCVGQEEGSQALRHVTVLGRELPMWAGAPAKVLLAGLSDAALKSIAEDSPLGAEHLATLLRWRDEVAEAGYAVSRGELEDGLSVVAVPIKNRDTVSAALSVAGPADRFTDLNVEKFAAELLKLADVLPNIPLIVEQLEPEG